jgi:hypothetical protein
LIVINKSLHKKMKELKVVVVKLIAHHLFVKEQNVIEFFFYDEAESKCRHCLKKHSLLYVLIYKAK